MMTADPGHAFPLGPEDTTVRRVLNEYPDADDANGDRAGLIVRGLSGLFSVNHLELLIFFRFHFLPSKTVPFSASKRKIDRFQS
jgi:hypothetical protein